MRSQRLARGALAAPLALVALAAACAQAASAASPTPLPASEHSQPTGRAVVLVEPAARSARTRDRISSALAAAGVWPAEGMAAPQVAGAAALIRSAKPILPATRVIEILKRSARPGTFTDGLGWGILDAKAALKLALKKKKGKGRKKKRKGSGKG